MLPALILTPAVQHGLICSPHSTLTYSKGSVTSSKNEGQLKIFEINQDVVLFKLNDVVPFAYMEK